ncbi:hypothetical protein [Candidatus Avelusimicrobium fimicolum]|uniref:hypothetical protein n=1 Tax=Candidatus Avelusimicrobium fimicolum TaxID=3416216 RepID=UPI003D0EEE44
MEKEQKKINKYASRSQMVEDIITWNDFYGPATKEAAYKERFAEIHARLLHSDGAKFPLAAFIQKHKLSAVEVFLLLRVSAWIPCGSCLSRSIKLQLFCKMRKLSARARKPCVFYWTAKALYLPQGYWALRAGA